MHTLLKDFRQGVRYSSQKAIHKEELRREEIFLIKNKYHYLHYKLIT